MANNKQKLELTWIGKNNPEYDISNIEPRILVENPELSNCINDPNTENMIIHGDNLLALRALLPDYEEKVKCIYIDPPYNTGNAFDHYDDSVEHSTWLSLMKPRLELLRMLLKDDGVIFVTVDDKEGHYIKIVCDEIFGRNNFIQTICWKSRDSISNDLIISPNHNFIYVYAKNQPTLFSKRKQFRLEKEFEGFSNPDNDPNGPWKLSPVDGPGGEKKGNPFYEFLGISGYWRYSEKTMSELHEKGQIIKRGKSLARKYYLSKAEESGGKTSTTWWDDCGTATEAKKEIIKLFPDNIFDTPKPERLMQRILTLGSEENDIILDSFLGSGTTCAVAHKMGRKYIGIEMGDHAYTHCKLRLDKVISGDDGLKLSEQLNWQGGGSYKFFELAPSFIVKDEFGNSVIDGFYNDAKLIRAMCKLMNFSYQPSPTQYWKHGVGQGKNYLYVTTQLLTSGMVQQIAAHLVEGESLIVCPKKFEPGADKIDDRITIKKIPQSVLKACHFGKKEYLLPIKETSIEEMEAEEEDAD